MQYDQFTRCLGLSEVVLRAKVTRAVNVAFETNSEAPLLTELKDTTDRAKDFRHLALQPYFHPPGFAPAGRERRVTSDASGYREAYETVLAFSNARTTEPLRLTPFVTADLAFCDRLRR
ncbi:MAG: hypothetical protein AAFU86_04740 [Pseudomonadota bacterium]